MDCSRGIVATNEGQRTPWSFKCAPSVPQWPSVQGHIHLWYLLPPPGAAPAVLRTAQPSPGPLFTLPWSIHQHTYTQTHSQGPGRRWSPTVPPLPPLSPGGNLRATARAHHYLAPHPTEGLTHGRVTHLTRNGAVRPGDRRPAAAHETVTNTHTSQFRVTANTSVTRTPVTAAQGTRVRRGADTTSPDNTPRATGRTAKKRRRSRPDFPGGAGRMRSELAAC